MAEHRIIMCNCRHPHPAILFEDGSAAMENDIPGAGWRLFEDSSASEKVLSPTPHPDPDVVWADYCAWRLTNG
jgi:hypothetical protein